MFKHSLSFITFCSSICLLLGLQVAIASFPSKARPSSIKRNLQSGTDIPTIMNKRAIMEKGFLDHFIKRSEHKGTKYNEMLTFPFTAPQPQPKPQKKRLQTVSTSQILNERTIVEKSPLDHLVKRVEHKYNEMLPGTPAPKPLPQWPKPWWMTPQKRDEKKHETYGQMLSLEEANAAGSNKRSIEEGKQ